MSPTVYIGLSEIFPTALYRMTMNPILPRLSEWAPFQLDALGLVTIFGAKEMNTSIGNLVRSWATDWLPVLGSYAVANNEFAQPEPGFVLYNITDGIMATDVAAWFTRWLSSVPLQYTSTTIRLRMDGRPMRTSHRACSMAIGANIVLLTLVLAVLTADWWGVANALAMALRVLVRQQMVGQLRASIDRTLAALQPRPGPDVKVFLTLPSGRAVTVRGPRQVVTGCLLTDARPGHAPRYFALRAAGWALFGAHAIALGMSNLFNQILTVVVLLAATYITAIHAGDAAPAIGKRLRLEVDRGDPSWSRSRAYARLDLTPEEEDSMVHWHMMPQRSNRVWWDRYATTVQAQASASASKPQSAGTPPSP